MERCLEGGREEVALIGHYPARTSVREDREFRTLMGLGISVLRQTLRRGLPMRLLVRLVDSQRGFLLSPVKQCLVTRAAALLTGGLAHRSARSLAVVAGCLIDPISGEYREALSSQ